MCLEPILPNLVPIFAIKHEYLLEMEKMFYFKTNKLNSKITKKKMFGKFGS